MKWPDADALELSGQLTAVRLLAGPRLIDTGCRGRRKNILVHLCEGTSDTAFVLPSQLVGCWSPAYSSIADDI